MFLCTRYTTNTQTIDVLEIYNYFSFHLLDKDVSKIENLNYTRY